MRTFLVIVMLLAMTVPALAMPKQMKSIAERYTKELSVYHPDCCGYTQASCVAVAEVDGVGYWLTAESNVVCGGLFSIDGHRADLVKLAEDGSAMLQTPDYAPFIGTIEYSLYPFVGEDFFYQNLDKYWTFNKMHCDWLDAYTFVCNTTPVPRNIGAPVFDYSGKFVGLVVGVAECGKCRPMKKPTGGTRVLRLTEDMLAIP